VYADTLQVEDADVVLKRLHVEVLMAVRRQHSVALLNVGNVSLSIRTDMRIRANAKDKFWQMK
jgi:hypothetical protein